MVHPLVEWGVLIAALFVFLWLDLHFFARGREPTFREGVIWSIGWLVVSLSASLVIVATDGSKDAV
ncbi:MAG: hypothetical protein QOE06_2286, partial [Thermoleophilaceae bacterium]|nr:hypothetical protein [Thermoleophilaceae bacterium]